MIFIEYFDVLNQKKQSDFGGKVRQEVPNPKTVYTKWNQKRADRIKIRPPKNYFNRIELTLKPGKRLHHQRP